MLMLPQFRQKRWIFFAALSAFYLCFLPVIGIIWAGDTLWYLNDSMRVSPIYPLLLKLFRLLFSERLYAYAIVAFQELLLAYAIFSFTDMLAREMCLGWHWRAACAAWLAFMLYGFRLLVIGGDTETFFCNAVLTEGIAYPLYLFFIKYWFLAVKHKSGRFLLSAAFVSFLLTGTRGQFYWLLIALFSGAIAIWRKNKAQNPRVFVLRVLGVAAAYALLSFGLSTAYHAIASGSAARTTLGFEVVLAAVLYDCEADSAAFLPIGSEEAVVLSDTLQTAYQNSWLSSAVTGNLFSRYRHYENHFDDVRIEYLTQLAHYHGLDSYSDIPSDVLASSAAHTTPIIPRLIAGHLSGYLKTRLLNAIAGVVRSNSIMNLQGTLLSAIVYFFAAGCLWFSRRSATYADVSLLLQMTLLCISLNALFCSFGVFALSRYMYYNFPLIYLALMLFFIVFLKQRRVHKDTVNVRVI